MSIKELFKISEGVSNWYLTSSDVPETYLGNDYVPCAMGRSENESKNELSRANVEVTFGIDNPIARRWLNQVIDALVTLTIFQKVDGAALVAWKGRLTAVKPEGANIKLVFESVFTSLRRPGIRARFQRSCRHVLYGRGCKVNKDLFALNSNVTNVSSMSVTVSTVGGHADGYYTGGMIKTPDGTLRMIMRHQGATLTLIRPVDTLTAAFIASGAQPVVLYPGCNRSREVCNGTFNNILNNGSFPFIPTRNIFGGVSFT